MNAISIPDSYRSRFPNIPAKLFEYFDRLLEMPSKNSRFHSAMVDHPEKTFEALDFQFKSGSEIVSLSPDDLLKRLDFNQNDLSPERIESLLGELRAIHFLHENGFIEIVPIRASRKRSPDFSAKKNATDFMIEVATSIYSAPRVLHDHVVNWATNRLKNDGKLSQLNTGPSESHKMFVCILNSSGAVALNQHSDYVNMVKNVWEELGSNRNLHIAIVTGKISLGEGVDDCVYPSI
jgi:hypothetical protein